MVKHNKFSKEKDEKDKQKMSTRKTMRNFFEWNLKLTNKITDYKLIKTKLFINTNQL